jgi:hypothetical protein
MTKKCKSDICADIFIQFRVCEKKTVSIFVPIPLLWRFKRPVRGFKHLCRQTGFNSFFRIFFFQERTRTFSPLTQLQFPLGSNAGGPTSYTLPA